MKDPRDFNQLAEELARGDRASQFRTSISRAYYAAYHVGTQAIVGMGFRISKGPGGHQELQRLLANCGDEQLLEAARHMALLRKARNDSDYDLQQTYLENSASALVHVRKADLVIEELCACLKEPRRSRIVAGIRAYLDKIGPDKP